LAFEPVLGMSMVRRLFNSTEQLLLLPSGEETAPTPTIVEHEKSPLCLGIFLTELWYEKPLNDIRADSNIARCDDADYELIKQSIVKLMTDAGDDYGCAVLYCIDGLFRWRKKLKSTKVTLNNEEFKNEVHINVVSRLKRSLEVSNSSGRYIPLCFQSNTLACTCRSLRGRMGWTNTLLEGIGLQD
jgi:hypothetical protein